MIQVLKDFDGFVYAYIVYQIVDKEGQFEDYGEYCFVQDLWIHKEYTQANGDPRRDVLREFIKRMHRDENMKNVKYIYWTNLKHGERLSRCYLRDRLAKMGK